MMNLKFKSGLLLILISLQATQVAYAITRCQDADGKWHYGDYATDVCNESKLTELNDRGFIVNEVDAPKTDEELAAAEQEAESQRLKEVQERETREEKERILSIYETEQDIDRQRDNKLNAVQSNIDVHKAYLKSLDANMLRYQEKKVEAKTTASKNRWQGQIDNAIKNKSLYSEELQVLLKQKQIIEMQYEKEKEVYLELKKQVIH